MDNDNEYLFKIVVIGNSGVGKSSLVRRYVHDEYSENYKATIGVEFANRKIRYEDKIINIQLWDLAGQDRISSASRVYFKDTAGALCVYDVTDPQSKRDVIEWKELSDRHGEDKILRTGPPAVLIANKCDKLEEPFDEVGLVNMRNEYEFVGAEKTSAKEGYGIDEAVESLIKSITVLADHKKMLMSKAARDYRDNITYRIDDNEVIVLNDDDFAETEKKSGCCWSGRGQPDEV